MKKWQIENSETSEISEISEILFRVFLFPSFRFCPIAKTENSDLNLGKKFPSFPSFRPGQKSSIKEDTRKKENCKANNIPEKHFLQKLLEIG